MASEGGLGVLEYQVSADEFTGSASVRVRVPATAARALTPRLALVGGGGGNSVVGLGWTLESVAAVTIDASEQLPRCIQFERNPSDAIDRIVNDLVAKGKVGQTAAELAAAIDATLASGISLTELDMSPERALDEETLRTFLVALRHRLRATDSSVC